LTQGDAAFELSFPLPAELVGQPEMEVTVEVNRTVRFPPDERQLGLVFGTFSVR
jgi:hypothetical protein